MPEIVHFAGKQLTKVIFGHERIVRVPWPASGGDSPEHAAQCEAILAAGWLGQRAAPPSEKANKPKRQPLAERAAAALVAVGGSAAEVAEFLVAHPCPSCGCSEKRAAWLVKAARTFGVTGQQRALAAAIGWRDLA